MIQEHPFWHLGGLLLFLLLFAVHIRAKKSGIFILALWNLTGVILHELAHLIAGILFRAEPTGFSIFPRREGGRWQLGAVTLARITPLNAVPVALAPLGLAGLAWLTANFWFSWFIPSLATTVGLYATLFFLLYNALPSRQDLRIACNWRSLLLYGSLALIIAALYLILIIRFTPQ